MNFFFLHINIRSLQKNFDDLVNLISQFTVLPDIICITETRLKHNPLINISIPGYDFVKANTSSFAGGVGMYVSSKLNFEVIAENTLDANCEDIRVCVKNIKTSKKILVAFIYRHPSSDTALFAESLNNKIADLDISNYNAYLLGDFNINIFMSRRSSDAQNYHDMLAVVGKLLAKSTEVTATGTFQKKYRSYRYRNFFKKVTRNFEVTSYYKQSAICNHKLAE